MLPLKKIYVDSRHRTADSVSSSNFKYELPYTVQLPDNCSFYVSEVSIPHVWKTIEDDINDRLYVKYTTGPGVGIPNYIVVQLTSQNYTGATLATEIQTKLNSMANAFISFTCEYIASPDFSLRIRCSGDNAKFKIYTDTELLQAGSSIQWLNNLALLVNVGIPNTANDIIKNVVPMSDSTELVTDFVNLQSINNVYITSPNLGSFDTIANFSNNIIKKVPVNVGYGFMIVDSSSDTSDYLNCSLLTLKTIEFHLRDGRGRYIDLHGMHITFSIIFNKFNLDN